MPTISPVAIGILRGLGFAALLAILTFLGDAAHLAGLSPWIATIISTAALAEEHSIEAKTGGALFGAVRSSK